MMLMKRNLRERLMSISNHLRPVPQYALSPFYELGSIMVVAFVIEVVTGLLMLPHYQPTPEEAYASTRGVIGRLPYGNLIGTLHLYTAYAMILLAFIHMMRNYFLSVYKKPRERTWMIGVVMGLITIGLGSTGYLLPWTVVSKSGVDLSIRAFEALPEPLGRALGYLIVGPGSDGTLLTRFYYLHIMVLPIAFLVLLALKIRVVVVHGPSEPIIGKPKEGSGNLVPRFPGEATYVLMLALLLTASMLTVSALFPLKLPPEYSPAAVANYTPQAEWYFLWIYGLSLLMIPQVKGLLAFTAALVIMLLILFLPSINKPKDRHPAKRPIFTTLGIILVAEIVGLTLWVILAPRSPTTIGEVVIVFGLALGIGIGSYLHYYGLRREWSPI